MNITCVTLSYNGAELTNRLIGSLELQTDRDFRVVVVDNDSDIDDREQLGAAGEAVAQPVEVISSPTNLGFSGGNNLGIRPALADGADWVVLLNNDTEVAPDFIATLRATLEARDGIVGLPIGSREVVRAGKRRWLALTLDHHPAPDGRCGRTPSAARWRSTEPSSSASGCSTRPTSSTSRTWTSLPRRRAGLPDALPRSTGRAPRGLGDRARARRCWPAITRATRSASTGRTVRPGSASRCSPGSRWWPRGSSPSSWWDATGPGLAPCSPGSEMRANVDGG